MFKKCFTFGAAIICLTCLLALYNCSIKNDIEQLYKNSVFTAYNTTTNETGTSVKISYGKESYYLTNAHVCSIASFLVMVNDTGTVVTEVASLNWDLDLCLLTPPKKDKTKAIPIPTNNKAISPFVYFLGYPKGKYATHSGIKLEEEASPTPVTYDKETFSYQEGELSLDSLEVLYVLGCEGRGINFRATFVVNEEKKQVTAFCSGYIETITTTMYTLPGASGSPVFSANREFVGLINSSSKILHHGSYIPLVKIHQFLEDYRSETDVVYD